VAVVVLAVDGVVAIAAAASVALAGEVPVVVALVVVGSVNYLNFVV
jgi:hypothetical protein